MCLGRARRTPGWSATGQGGGGDGCACLFPGGQVGRSAGAGLLTGDTGSSSDDKEAINRGESRGRVRN